MKNGIYLIVIVLCIISATVTGCAQKGTETAAEPATGAYTEDRAPGADDLLLFESVMSGLDGVQYEPTLVATQVVAGVNYRFTATATPIVPDAKPYTAYVYIYQPLNGEPELTDIVTSDSE